MMATEERAMLDMDGMPEYSLRVSVRAKRLQMNVTAWGKVEVVVPRHVSLARVEPFVFKHRDWLIRTLENLRSSRGCGLNDGLELPSNVHLAALAQDWHIDYCYGSRIQVIVSRNEEHQRLQVISQDMATARVALRDWFRKYSGSQLLCWLKAVSDECGLSYARATVRAQKTRWGSCSARAHINLNWQLIFLPPQLVRYLCIHELCHTVHLNHSKRYWSLVGRYAPQHVAHESELRKAIRHVPLWAYAE